MDKIMQFLDLIQPCPAEVPDCEQLRREYVKDHEDMKKRGGCGQCMERNFKNQWIVKLQGILQQPGQ